MEKATTLKNIKTKIMSKNTLLCYDYDGAIRMIHSQNTNSNKEMNQNNGKMLPSNNQNKLQIDDQINRSKLVSYISDNYQETFFLQPKLMVNMLKASRSHVQVS